MLKTMERVQKAEKEADAILKQLERLQAKVDRFHEKHKGGLWCDEDELTLMTAGDDADYSKVDCKVHKVLQLKKYL